MTEKNVICKVSTEKLSHFTCGKCGKWWAIGDAPQKEKWFCPWCGAEQIIISDKKG